MKRQEGLVHQKETVSKNEGLLIVLTGPTASGKDAVVEKLLSENPQTRRVVTYTTRKQRKGEKQGADYRFISKEDFMEMKENDEFLETNQYDGNFYGTGKGDVESVLGGQDKIWRIDVSRAGQIESCLKENFPSATAEELLKRTLVIFIGTPRLTVLKDRFLRRREDKNNREKLKKRLKTDWKDWKRWEEKFENVIINEPGALGKTMREVRNLIERHKQNTTAKQRVLPR